MIFISKYLCGMGLVVLAVYAATEHEYIDSVFALMVGLHYCISAIQEGG